MSTVDDGAGRGRSDEATERVGGAGPTAAGEARPPVRRLIVDLCNASVLPDGRTGLMVQGWVRGPADDVPTVLVESTPPFRPIRLEVPLDRERRDVPVSEGEAVRGFRVNLQGPGLQSMFLTEAQLVVRCTWTSGAVSEALLARGPAMGLAPGTPGLAERPLLEDGPALELVDQASPGYSWSLGARAVLDHYSTGLARASQRRRVAVLTHAMSPRAWFPYWHDHYSRSVGARNLFVTTADPDAFRDFELGGVIGLEGWAFSDFSRAALHSGLLQGLLARYEAVLLADVDEIVVSSLDYDLPLSDWAFDAKSGPGYRTIGFDVARTDGEGPFDFTRRVIDQRSRGRANTGVFKASMFFVPQFVSVGFHGSSERLAVPDAPLILLHLKRADLDVMSGQLQVVEKLQFAEERKRLYHHESISKELKGEEETLSFEEFLSTGFVRRFLERDTMDSYGFWHHHPFDVDEHQVDLTSIFGLRHLRAGQ